MLGTQVRESPKIHWQRVTATNNWMSLLTSLFTFYKEILKSIIVHVSRFGLLEYGSGLMNDVYACEYNLYLRTVQP